jgi:hypothetical protein
MADTLTPEAILARDFPSNPFDGAGLAAETD